MSTEGRQGFTGSVRPAAKRRAVGAVTAAISAGALFAAAPTAFAQTIAAAPPAPASLSDERALALAARLDELARRNDELARRNAELGAQVAELRAMLTADEAAAHKAAAGPPAVAFSGPRPTFASADGRFSTTVHAVMQLDAATYDQAGAGPVASDLRRSGPALGASTSNVDLVRARNLKSGTVFRRARFGLDGKAFGDWEYRIIADFGGPGVENAGQLFETWVQYNGLQPAHIRIGAFPPSVGLEDQGAVNGAPFLERSTVADLARGLAGGDSRTAGQVFGYGDRWFAAAAVTGRTVGSLNSGTASPVAQSYGDQLAYTGRIAATPVKGGDWLMHVGANGSFIAHPADAGGPGTTGLSSPSGKAVTLATTPEIRVDATKLINTGAIPARHADSMGAEFAVQHDKLLLQAEYQRLGVQRSDGFADPHFSGYYLSGTWMLTGERRPYNGQTAAFDGPPVRNPFSYRHGGWGAWELAARYSDMHLDFDRGPPGTLQTGASIPGGEEKNLTAAINWYWNPLARLMLAYQHVQIDRLSPANSASAASTIWLTPAGAQIGQDFNVWSVRSQFAF